MKKVFSIIAVAVVATFVACGPSAEEKAAAEERAKFVQDSIAAAVAAAVETSAVDSTAAMTEPAAPAVEEAHH